MMVVVVVVVVLLVIVSVVGVVVMLVVAVVAEAVEVGHGGGGSMTVLLATNVQMGLCDYAGLCMKPTCSDEAMQTLQIELEPNTCVLVALG